MLVNRLFNTIFGMECFPATASIKIITFASVFRDILFRDVAFRLRRDSSAFSRFGDEGVVAL